MAYASVADMVARFGDLEVIELTDRSHSGQIDEAVAKIALEDATAEIDAYLGRFRRPFYDVPPILKRLCCDIARYRLLGADAQETEPARNRYRDAIRLLEQVRDGKMTLGLDTAQQPVGTGATIKINNGRRMFAPGSLDDY